MSEKIDIITIGESLIELSTNDNLTNANCLDKYYGGDTLTTAIAALRLGSKVGFVSRVGMDCFKNYLLESWQEEGLDISHVKPVQGVNGLYIVSKLEDSESKEYSLYRKKTAATNLSIEDISTDYIKNSTILYSTGITQSLSISARETVREAFKIAKENCVTVAYDPNFSSQIWSDEEAKEAFEEIAEYIDIIFLNTEYDSKIVIDTESIDNTIKYLWDKGISSIIIRSNKEKGYWVGAQGKIEFINYYPSEIIDDTGAGDAFNGGVLHAIANGMSAFKAVNLGAIVAGLQIKNFGAIKSIPKHDEVYKIYTGQNE